MTELKNLPTTPEQKTNTELTTFLGGFMERMMGLLENNNKVMETCASAVNSMNGRMESIEKQIRLNTPLTPAMASYLTGAIRAKAKEIADKHAGGNTRARTIIAREIRKELFVQYGVSDMRSIPRHEYEVAMERVGMMRWTLKLSDTVKAAVG